MAAWCLPNTETHLTLALYNVLVMTRWRGGGLGVLLQKIFGFKGVKLCFTQITIWGKG